jgi:hypothetical protein
MLHGNKKDKMRPVVPTLTAPNFIVEYPLNIAIKKEKALESW